MRKPDLLDETGALSPEEHLQEYSAKLLNYSISLEKAVDRLCAFMEDETLQCPPPFNEVNCTKKDCTCAECWKNWALHNTDK